jgi:hypothetical protein
MTALKLPPPVLAVLAVGVVWWLTQRRAVAAPLYGATPAAVNNGAVQRYQIPVSGITPQAPAATPLQAALQFATALINRPSQPSSAATPATAGLVAQYAYGGPSMGVYGQADQAIIRPADYVPTFTPDAQGEAAAQSYYLSNPDEFIANPPTLYNTTYSGVDAAGGWLDNQ